MSGVGHPLAEFQAVILAGGAGNLLSPLTDAIPKPLLTVGNRPLLSFQLELLERAGFDSVLVITKASYSEKLSEYLKNDYRGDIGVDLHVIGEEVDTVGAILLARDKITSDFFVLSSDVIADVLLYRMADMHRAEDAVATILLKQKAVHKDASETTGRSTIVGMDSMPVDYVGLDMFNRRIGVCFWHSGKKRSDNIVVSKSITSLHQNLSIRSDLADAHIYLFSPWIFALIESNPKLKNVKDDLLPYLIRKQHVLSRNMARAIAAPLRTMSSDLIKDLAQVSKSQEQTIRESIDDGHTTPPPNISTSNPSTPLKNPDTSSTSLLSSPKSSNAPLGISVLEIDRPRSLRKLSVDYVNEELDSMFTQKEYAADGPSHASTVGSTITQRTQYEQAVPRDSVISQTGSPVPASGMFNIQGLPGLNHRMAMGMSSAAQGQEIVSCNAKISDSQYCNRIVDIYTYIEANLEIAAGVCAPYLPTEKPGKNNYVAEGVEVPQKSTIGPDCICGANSVLGDRVSIKKSVIGRGVTMGEKVKISGSVILDNAVIHSGATITGCVVGVGATVNSSAVLKSCVVGCGYNVLPGSDVKGHVLCKTCDE